MYSRSADAPSCATLTTPFPTLPRSGRAVPWPLDGDHSRGGGASDVSHLIRALERDNDAAAWNWPTMVVNFIADPHADTEAFIASLYASGGVSRRGPGQCDFVLNAKGRAAEFIIGGDCLDKGPANLELLRAIRRLIEQRARVTLLAGNHDIRLLIGLRCLGAKGDPTTEHLFLRMGPKVVPLLKEVWKQHLATGDGLRGVPDENACRAALFPGGAWFDTFPRATRGRLTPAMIERELIRMRRKVDTFDAVVARAGLTMRQIYAAARHCRAMFLHDDGEFAWFFRDMQLISRRGACLFVHAGIDDQVIDLVDRQGIDGVNRRFAELAGRDPFALYYGPIGNAFRTKYRDVDMPLTERGVLRAHALGLRLVIHGHRNRTTGQRVVLRQGMMHMECDITLDRNSRWQEGLNGVGAGVTVIHPAGYIVGLSNDYPDAKLFDPAAVLQQGTQRIHAA